MYVPESKYKQEDLTQIVTAAGGATTTKARGSYIMESGVLCEEDVLAIKVYYADDNQGRVDVAVAEYLASLLEGGEESVLIEGSAGTLLFTK
jgi:hypothetical protein